MLGRFAEAQWSRSASFADDVRYLNALYDAEVRFADEIVGGLIAAIDRMGRLDSTLVIVTSDHGEGLMERGVLQHGVHLHRELLHVPLVMRFPGRAKAGTRRPDRVRIVDIVPTVLDWIGLPQPEQVQGRSLFDASKDGVEGRAAFAQGIVVPGAEADLQMYSQGRWKLIRDERLGSEALFDIESDPRELENLVGRADPTVVVALREALDQLVAENRERSARYPVAPGKLDRSEIERLETLGYIVEPDGI